jgi:hypothetical protein
MAFFGHSLCQALRLEGMSPGDEAVLEGYLRKLYVNSGPEFVIDKLKVLKEYAINLLNNPDLPFEHVDGNPSISHKNGQIKGPLSIFFKRYKGEKLVRVIGASINAVYLEAETSKQIDKLLKGVNSYRRTDEHSPETKQMLEPFRKYIERWSNSYEFDRVLTTETYYMDPFGPEHLTGSAIPFARSDDGYYNESHALRDSKDILGMEWGSKQFEAYVKRNLTPIYMLHEASFKHPVLDFKSKMFLNNIEFDFHFGTDSDKLAILHKIDNYGVNTREQYVHLKQIRRYIRQKGLMSVLNENRALWQAVDNYVTDEKRLAMRMLDSISAHQLTSVPKTIRTLWYNISSMKNGYRPEVKEQVMRFKQYSSTAEHYSMHDDARVWNPVSSGQDPNNCMTCKQGKPCFHSGILSSKDRVAKNLNLNGGEEYIGTMGFLQQAGGKLRTVFNVNRAVQWTIEPFAKAIESVIYKHPAVFVKDQRAGLEWAKRHLREGDRMVSLDLTSATDLLDFRPVLHSFPQVTPLQKLYNETFEELAMLPSWVGDDNSRFSGAISLGTGQPLGLKGSFQLLTAQNLAAGLYAASMANEDPHDSFAIVGDDFVCKSSLAPYYKMFIEHFHGETNLEKALESDTHVEFLSHLVTKSQIYKMKPKYHPGQEALWINADKLSAERVVKYYKLTDRVKEFSWKDKTLKLKHLRKTRKAVFA